jgi:tRNA-dihydrouridine synthase B
MGCSVRRVSGRGAGAGLLRDPEKAGRIINSLVRNLDIPVTAKIRLGWNQEQLNYLNVASILEENGASLIAVHGRTRAQGYGGEADWDAIAAIKEQVSIPVIGNGDVNTLQDIERIKNHTRCDAVMIGRAAMGNPWIFQHREQQDIPLDEIAKILFEHLELMIAFYGFDRGPTRFRKHLVRYLKPFKVSDALRKEILSTPDMNHFVELLATAGVPTDSFSKITLEEQRSHIGIPGMVTRGESVSPTIESPSKLPAV